MTNNDNNRQYDEFELILKKRGARYSYFTTLVSLDEEHVEVVRKMLICIRQLAEQEKHNDRR